MKNRPKGIIDPLLKVRINNLQHYIERMYNEHDLTDPVVKEVVKVLIERKEMLVNQI